MRRKASMVSVVAALSWLAILLLWIRFWWLDLRFAKASLLLALPLVTAFTGAATMVGLRLHPWKGFAHGLVYGFVPLCLYFWDRATHVGCVGVSEAYGDAVAGSLVLFVVLGITRWYSPARAAHQ